MEQRRIRNFAIIAHIDHGKSTLADRFLEITKTIPQDKIIEQFLDQNPISRERGITIKLAPVRMNYEVDNEEYLLNLIDTPGHMDFSYEVSRTLAACEGAILLVDATQGVQAQTVAHYYSAKKENLFLIPAINKIDLPTANVEKTITEIVDFFGFKKEEIIQVSAKTGINADTLLKEVVKKIPPPSGKPTQLRALVFDAVFDEHRGVIAFVKIVDGKISTREKVKFLQTGTRADISELGFFSPYLKPKAELATGEIGYLVTGIKDIRKVRVGDTISLESNENYVDPLPGYDLPKPMVFYGVYPKDQSELISLKEGLSKLALNDASLAIASEYSAFLGTGFRVGFLGMLHAEIVKERLKEEEGIDPLLTTPRVLYNILPDGSIQEPFMKLTIYVPSMYAGAVMTVCQKNKGKLVSINYHNDNAVLEYEIPYSMFIRGIASDLKTVSSGFASIDYVNTDYREADLVNLEILINGNSIDVLSELVYKDEAINLGREKTEQLKEALSRQQFRQIVQAVVQGKVVARAEIAPFRKDVIEKLYGGDRTRKDKLLKKQKKGKARMISHAKVNLPQEALLSVFNRRSEGK